MSNGDGKKEGGKQDAAGTSSGEGKKTKVEEPAAVLDVDMIEEDDEFEEFPVEDWPEVGDEDVEEDDVNVWEDNWDDDTVEDDFSRQLRAVLQKRSSSQSGATGAAKTG